MTAQEAKQIADSKNQTVNYYNAVLILNDIKGKIKTEASRGALSLSLSFQDSGQDILDFKYSIYKESRFFGYIPWTKTTDVKVNYATIKHIMNELTSLGYTVKTSPYLYRVFEIYWD